MYVFVYVHEYNYDGYPWATCAIYSKPVPRLNMLYYNNDNTIILLIVILDYHLELYLYMFHTKLVAML